MDDLTSTWIFRGKRPAPSAETKKAIRAGRFYAGWELSEYGKSDWQWCNLICDTDGSLIRCEYARDCLPEEKRILNELLKGDIVCRVVILKEGAPWALACTE